MRVATAFLNSTSLSRIQTSNSNLADLTFQVTSGQKSNRLSDISSDAAQLLSLQDLKRNTEIYNKNIDTALSRLTASENALTGMNDLLTEAVKLGTLGRSENSASTRATLAPKAQSLAESFFNTLKTKFDGRYVFSGQDGSKPPTNAVATQTATPADPPPTTYYTGDAAQAEVVSGPTGTTLYGILGNNTAFARVKAGLEGLWNGLATNNVTDMDNALTMLKNAQSNLSELVGQVGGQQAGLEQLKERHAANATGFEERITQLDSVDITAAMTQFSQEQATLQASMLVISRLSQLSLLDFI